MTKQELAEQIREAGKDLAAGDPLTSWREIYLAQRKVSAFFRRWQTAIAHRPAGTMTHTEINAAFSAIYSVTELVESHIHAAAQNVARETTTLEEMSDKELADLTDTAENMEYHFDRAVNLIDAMRVALDNDTFITTSVVTGIMELGSRGLAAIRDTECRLLSGFAVRATKEVHDRKERLKTQEVEA